MDFSTVTQAIAMASSAVGLTGQAATTAQAIKKIITADGTADQGETAQLLNTLASELTAANMMNVQISDALRQLNKEWQRENEFEIIKAQYERWETPVGDIVYRFKPADAQSGPTHYICPVCLNRDKLVSFVTGDNYYKSCQTESAHTFDFQKAPDYSRSSSHDGW